MRLRYLLYLVLFPTLVFCQSFNITHYNANNSLDEDCISASSFGYDGFFWMMNNTKVIRFDGKEFKYFSLLNNNRPLALLHNKHLKTLIVVDHLHNVYKIMNAKLVLQKGLVFFKNVIPATGNSFLYLSSIAKYPQIKKLPQQPCRISIISKDEFYIKPIRTKDFFHIKNGNVEKLSLTKTDKDIFFIWISLLEYKIYLNEYEKSLEVFQLGKKLYSQKMSTLLMNRIINHFLNNSEDDSYFIIDGKLLKLKVSKTKVSFDTLATNIPIYNGTTVHYFKQTNEFYITDYRGLYIVKTNPFEVISPSKFRPVNAFILKNDSMLTNFGNLFIKNQLNKKLFDEDGFSMLMKDNKFFYVKGYLFHYYNTTQKKETMIKGLYYSDTNSFFHYSFAIGPQNKVFISANKELYYLEKDSAVHFARVKESINVFKFINDSIIIFGSDKGLYRYYTTTKRTEYILKNVYVRNIQSDKQKNIWVGTYGQGFFIINKIGKVVKMPLDEKNECLRYAHAFVNDSSGNVWISTNNGLIKARLHNVYEYVYGKTKKVNYFRFTTKDGLPRNEFNGGAKPCSGTDNKGNIYFASLEGVVKFNPNNIKVNLDPSNIYIDDVLGDGVSYDPNKLIVFPNKTFRISIQLAIPKFANNANFRHEFKIENYINDWNNIDSKGEVVLNSLAPGVYKILVRKTINETNSTFIYKTIYIEISRAFYQTNWFIVLVSMCILVLLFWFYWLRITSYKKTERDLKMRVDVKTIELSQSNELQQRLIRVLAHDVKSPLKATYTVLSYVIIQLIKAKKGQIKDDEMEEMGELVLKVTDSVKSLYDYSDDFLMWYNSKMDFNKIQISAFDLKGLVDSILKIYAPLISLKENKLLNQMEEEIMVLSDKSMLQIIIRNLIDNAYKYTNKNLITISSKKSTEEITVNISNFGRPMSDEEINYINNKLEIDEENLEPREGQKMGLGLVSFFCKRLGYKIKFETSNGIHQFVVSIPIISSTT